MLRLSLVALSAVLCVGCDSMTKIYQERLVSSLAYQREVSFSDAKTYRGKVLCGRYTAIGADGFSSIGGDYIGFYPQGCIFSNFCEGNFESKRLSNVFAKTYCTVGVLTVESMKKLKEAYPDWFTEFVEANKIALKL
jgi:hypothetical protein